MLVTILFISFIFTSLCSAKVTNKQYASMPELFYQDNYDKCMLLEDEALYCFFTYQLEPLNPTNVPEIWKIIEEVSSDEYNYRHDHLRHGICIPLTCPNIGSNDNETILLEGITNCYNKKFKNMELKGIATNLLCETNKPKYPVDWLDISVAMGFICYVILIIFASFYEGAARYKSEKEYQRITSTRWGRVTAVFSVPRNWHRLKTVKSSPEVETLRSFQGVRFYNTLIVVTAHTSLSFFVSFITNTKDTESVTQSFSNIFLSSGTLAVSTNFFMSSFFLLYGFFIHFEGKREITLKFLVLAFIKRYLRLTPALATVIIFHSTWLRHFVGGPNWYSSIGKEYLRCRKNWWTNLLYMNNLIDRGNMCMGHTWYSALDMQYFVIFLLIVWLVKKFSRFIWPIIGCLLCINLVGTFVENYRGNYTAFLIPFPELLYDTKILLNNPQWHYQHHSIIGNTAGSIMGLGFGYLFYKYRNQELHSLKLIRHQIVYYIISHGFPLGIIILPGIHFMVNRAQHDPFWASMYTALSRPIFSFGIGCLLLGTTQGLGWLLKYCMEWRPTYILGRLSYSAYLINVSVMLSRSTITRFPIHVSDFAMVYFVMGDIFMTYTAALLLVLIVEMPTSALQNLIFPSKLTSDESTETTKDD